MRTRIWLWWGRLPGWCCGTTALLHQRSWRTRATKAEQAAQIDDPVTGLPFGFQKVFLRGEAQTNTAVRLSQSLFSKLGDYRASVGMEVRVQVPIINVPFRLIFAYNPKARENQVIDGFPFFFNEKKKVIRFSVGRTF